MAFERIFHTQNLHEITFPIPTRVCRMLSMMEAPISRPMSHVFMASCSLASEASPRHRPTALNRQPYEYTRLHSLSTSRHVPVLSFSQEKSMIIWPSCSSGEAFEPL
ncbi:hypothetical protein JZ751_015081 [Albula glossodonta]|uniref:Uncharacterized protein n=1 Tax=Albula glossodonta TaxID=121402 RepID=A0A8T2NR76_9TELE|nr:hypothetical protein JZ751_015081 [Albula glossodonta]